MDDQVNASERSEVEAHLASCEACRLDLESLRITVGLLSDLPQIASLRDFTLSAPPEPIPAQRSAGWSTGLATSLVAVLLVALLLGDITGLLTQERALEQSAQSTAAPASAAAAAPAASMAAPAAAVAAPAPAPAPAPCSRTCDGCCSCDGRARRPSACRVISGARSRANV
jgi:anti-sigma factor RsiW